MLIVLKGMILVALFILSIWDIRYKKIPVVFPLICSMICLLIRIFCKMDFFEFLFTAGACFLFFLLAGKASRGQIGSGDAFVFLMTGMELGFIKSLWLIYLSFFFAFFAAAFFFFIRKKGKRYEIPFVPFISLAYAVLLFYDGL
ncbi:MAG: hypothetical protein IJ733_09900 [Lachnospiraceae bacterium]|nr:hypothetical protein [Lachnospiraceae bacterium]